MLFTASLQDCIQQGWANSLSLACGVAGETHGHSSGLTLRKCWPVLLDVSQRLSTAFNLHISY
jgi:hypothetical protein